MSNTSLAFDEWQDRRPMEYIGGKVFLMAPPSKAHNLVSLNIYDLFRAFLKKGGPCQVLHDTPYVRFSKRDTFKPDVLVLCDPSKYRADGYIYGAPDLVVEILSPSTAKNDLGHKKTIYEKNGVREYWIVSTGDLSIQQYLLEDGAYFLNDVYTVRPDWELENLNPEEREAVVTEFPCGIFPDLIIPLEEVFRDLIPV